MRAKQNCLALESKARQTAPHATHVSRKQQKICTANQRATNQRTTNTKRKFMKTRQVILATDLSANAVFAAQWAHEYAQRAGAQVLAAHIVEISVPNWLRDAYNVLDDDGERAKVEARINSWYTQHTKGTLDGIVLDVGNIEEKLGEIAKAHENALIVVAKSGKSTLTKLLAGSTAQMLTANPPCPVVIVHPDHATFNEHTHVVVATDLTETATDALAEAAAMAKLLGTTLDVVHASTMSSSPSIDPATLPQDLSTQALCERAKNQMNEVISKHNESLEGVQCNTHIVEAHPVEALTGFAQKHGSDLVFVGNAAHYNVITNVFGRVSVKLMQTLDTTVFVVPPHNPS